MFVTNVQMAKTTIPNFFWILLAAGLLYSVFSLTARLSTPAPHYSVGDGWKWWPRGFWVGRPVAPHAGYPGVVPPHPGPHAPPQGPPHGPPKPGGIEHPILQ